MFSIPQSGEVLQVERLHDFVVVQMLLYVVGVHFLFVWSYVLVSVDYNVSFSLFFKYCFVDIFYDFTSLNDYVFAALATPLQLQQILQLPQPLQPLQIGHRFHHAHIAHHAHLAHHTHHYYKLLTISRYNSKLRYRIAFFPLEPKLPLTTTMPTAINPKATTYLV